MKSPPNRRIRADRSIRFGGGSKSTLRATDANFLCFQPEARRIIGWQYPSLGSRWTMQIRQAAVEDAGRVAKSTTSTFSIHDYLENQAVPVEEMARRIRRSSAPTTGSWRRSSKRWWVTLTTAPSVPGRPTPTPWKPPSTCAGVYRQGLGTQLYEHLIESIRRGGGFRELIGVVALPNPASIALHRKMGFVEAGLLKNVGYKFGRYLDVSFWQRSLLPR